jgi:hypothetical protein
MFITNCDVKLGEVVHAQQQRPAGKGRKRRANEEQLQQQEQQEEEEEQEVLHPVCCAVCGEQVGVQDPADEVVHFFNVLASEC